MSFIDDAEVIVVGSGPAGVSAAWPLVEAGIRVLMLDASRDELPASPGHSTLAEWRNDPERWRFELGDGPLVGSAVSPKFATPLSRATLADFADAVKLEARNYLAVGSLAAGGLSRIWGALAVPYGTRDLAGFAAEEDRMRDSYRHVAARIGLSGSTELPADGATMLTPAVARLAQCHQRCSEDPDFEMTAASNAVLAAPRGERLSCSACGLCLYGCGRGSIYQSAAELPSLRRFSNFRYRSNVQVERLSGVPGAHVIEGRSDGGAVRLQAPVIVLAAGTLMTSSLALRRIGFTGRPVRLLNNPVGGAAFLVPALVGKALPERSFGLGQLFYTLRPEEGVEAAGVFYGADTLPLATIADRLPFSRPTALRLGRALAPALLLATGYLPGQFSDNTLIVDEDERGARLFVEGRQNAEADRLLRETFRRLSKRVRRRGALPVPGSQQLLQAGADAHPTSTLPMGGNGPVATHWSGELQSLSGIYVADGASLPLLSARHPTLTIMANADRLGRALARRVSVRPTVSHAC